MGNGSIDVIKRMNFCGLCTTGACDECERKKAKDEAIKALETQEKLKEELAKMEEEVKKCYNNANDCERGGLKITQRAWTARAHAFRDCIDILKKIMGREENK